jgi:hypothetical protein
MSNANGEVRECRLSHMKRPASLSKNVVRGLVLVRDLGIPGPERPRLREGIGDPCSVLRDR